MCHSPQGHAERVGSMYNDPKERHRGGETMSRMDCGCCVGSEIMTDVAWEKEFFGRGMRHRRGFKNTEWREKAVSRFFLPTSTCSKSMIQLFDREVWEQFELSHRQRFSLTWKEFTFQEGPLCILLPKTWDQVRLGLWLCGTTFHSS